MKSEYALEIVPVDITPYQKGNTGVDYITTFDSNQSGPHVMINAIVHGNELCGAIVLDFLFRDNIQPKRGKLSLSFANHEAYHSYDPENPDASRYVEENFNRVWDKETLEGERDNLEIRRAREMRPIVDTVDYLLDIHSMQHKTPPLMLSGMCAKGRHLAQQVGIPEHVVTDFGHAAGLRMRDYGGFADETSLKNALLVECGQHWEKMSVTVALESTIRFLLCFEMIDSDFAKEHLGKIPILPQKFIEVTEAVTIKTDQFRFTQQYKGMEVIPKQGTILAYDGEQPIETPYHDCTLIMPSKTLTPGLTAVRLGQYI